MMTFRLPVLPLAVAVLGGDRATAHHSIVGSPGRNAGGFRLLMRSLRRLSDNFGWGDDPDEIFD
jgi:hypothetical protein